MNDVMGEGVSDVTDHSISLLMSQCVNVPIIEEAIEIVRLIEPIHKSVNG